MADTDNCLNYLLPAKRDSEIISSLRSAKEYPLLFKNNSIIIYSIHTVKLSVIDLIVSM